VEKEEAQRRAAESTRAILEERIEMDEDTLLAGAEDEFDDSSYWEDDENVDWDAVQEPVVPLTRPRASSPEGIIRWANKRTISNTDKAEQARKKFQRMMEMSEEDQGSQRIPLGETQASAEERSTHIVTDHELQSTPSKPALRTLPSTQRKLGTTPRVAGPTVSTPSIVRSTPLRRIALGSTPRMQGTTPRPFRSPFLDKSKVGNASTDNLVIGAKRKSSQAPRGEAATVFCLEKPNDRKSLRQLALTPSWHWHETERAFDREDIRAILQDPHCARRFLFDGQDGVEEARTALSVAAGCAESSISLDWVRNHYGLIVWKLAGLARHCDEQVSRFTWTEVLKQLLYRYERECNRSQRSAVKLIQERDASAARPMILCVYDTTIDEQDATLTLTDGWYRLQACIAGPLLRAVQKGKIKVGCKLAISSAQLADDEVACDPLQAFLSSRIRIAGNSVKLTKWDARLGFCKLPFFSTVRSLSADGGIVSLMDVVIMKVYPKAFMEEASSNTEATSQASQRQQTFTGAWNEAEELEKREEWKARREALMEGVSGQMEEQAVKLRHIVELLDSACEDLSTDETPFHIDSSACEGQLDAMLTTTDPSRYLNAKAVLPTLLTLARGRLETMYSQAHEEKNRLIEARCPTRSVRSFQILRVCDSIVAQARGVHVGVDATPSAKLLACKRDALVRVWDVGTGEEEAQFCQGDRYYVTNLVPYRVNSWPTGIDDADDVHLTTRRDSRWTLITSARP
jgi:breast cancer 2 susceptibility protein